MVEIILISTVAFAASMLTFFSGFGLGTILMPFVAIFLPLEMAIAITAIVHFANNLFKIGLVYRHINYPVLFSFGATALVFAAIGAILLKSMGEQPALLSYQIFGMSATVTALKIAIGIIILAFVVLESVPRFANMAFDQKYMPLGGALSGFFGGFSGHQGAFRSMFLLKAKLEKEVFIATGIAIAVIVDISRLAVYGTSFSSDLLTGNFALITTATLFAFVGSFFGAKLLKKVTIEFVKNTVSIVLVLLSLLLVSGII
jgi:uncharacterized membrane protein YfcA